MGSTAPLRLADVSYLLTHTYQVTRTLRFLVEGPSLIKWTWGHQRIDNLPLCLLKHLRISDLNVWRNKAGKRQRYQLRNDGQQEQNGEK